MRLNLKDPERGSKWKSLGLIVHISIHSIFRVASQLQKTMPRLIVADPVYGCHKHIKAPVAIPIHQGWATQEGAFLGTGDAESEGHSVVTTKQLNGIQWAMDEWHGTSHDSSYSSKDRRSVIGESMFSDFFKTDAKKVNKKVS